MIGLQLELFPDIGIEPTIAMQQGRSRLWQCVACGVLVCVPSNYPQKKPAWCPCCEQSTWSTQNYAGPFKRKQVAQ